MDVFPVESLVLRVEIGRAEYVVDLDLVHAENNLEHWRSNRKTYAAVFRWPILAELVLDDLLDALETINRYANARLAME